MVPASSGAVDPPSIKREATAFTDPTAEATLGAGVATPGGPNVGPTHGPATHDCPLLKALREKCP